MGAKKDGRRNKKKHLSGYPSYQELWFQNRPVQEVTFPNDPKLHC